MDQRTRDLLDNIGQPIFALEAGEDGMPRYCAFNRTARAILGRCESEIYGLTAEDLYSGRLGQIALEHHLRVMRSGVEATYELTLPLKDGRRRIRTTLTPVLDDAGQLLHMFGSSTDITEQQALKEMKIGAETLSKELGEFVSGAALDLRRPMLKVKSVADMLRDGFQDLGDGKLELIGLLEKLSSDAMSLVNDVLGHAEAVSAAGELIDFDFAELAKEIMALLDPLGKCAFHVNQKRIRGDRTATAIVLRNLIENALRRHQEAGLQVRGVQPTIEVSAADHSDGFFAVTVSDNSGPLARTTLSFLNGLTLRTDGSRSLLGVRRLVLARGGKTTAHNRPDGAGAIVQFTLPGAAYSEARPEHDQGLVEFA